MQRHLSLQTNHRDAERAVCLGAALVADVAAVEGRVGFHLDDGIVEVSASVLHLAVFLALLFLDVILRHVGIERLFNHVPFLLGGVEFDAVEGGEVIRFQLLASDERLGDSALVNHLPLEDVVDVQTLLGVEACRDDHVEYE